MDTPGQLNRPARAEQQYIAELGMLGYTGGRRRGMGDDDSYTWGDVFKDLALQGGNIAQQVFAPLAQGEFWTRDAQGNIVRSRGVPGAIPTTPTTSMFQMPTAASISPTLIIAGLAGVAVLAMAMKR